jgi:hypothetical protein
MEEVLDLSEEEDDPRYPLICFDETRVAPHTLKRQPGTPLARGYRRQRSEPQAAVARRG